MINVDTSIFETPSAITIKVTEEKGREYIANQLIEKDTTILKVSAYATAIFDSYKKRICAYCLCTHPSKSFSTHCLGCDQVYFCSTACATIYLVDHQDDICESLRKLATLKKVDKNMKSIGKLILMIYWERHKERRKNIKIDQQQQQFLIKEDNKDMELKLNSTIKKKFGFDLVNQLESHYDKWPLEIKKDWMRLHSFLLKQLQQFHWLLPHESDMDIMHLASKIESNGFGIYLEKKMDILAGRAIYPLASLFNHDCNFNCEVEQWTEEGLENEKIKLLNTNDDDENINNNNNNKEKEKENDKVGNESKFIYPSIFNQTHGKFRQMFIRTTRQVQKGEALTIGYIDTNLPLSSRRHTLLQDYYFTCQCNKCTEEFNQISSKKKKETK